MKLTITTRVWAGEYDPDEFPGDHHIVRDGMDMIITETRLLDERSTVEIESS